MATAGPFFAILRAFPMLSALTAAACASGRPVSRGAAAEGPGAPSTEAPTESTSETPAAIESRKRSAADEPPPVPPSEPSASAAVATPLELCNKMCDRVASACTKSAAAACHVNCEQYAHPPRDCDEQVRAALECAAKAPDVTCVVIAPDSCAHEFRRVLACTTGKEDPGPRESVELRTPEGWERFEVKSQGFALVMPKGVSEKTDEKPPAYSVEQGQATYSVRILPPPKEKPTQKNLVPFATKLLGACARKMKLFGLIERPERVTIRYDSRCADGTEWRGALVMTTNKMYMLKVTSPAGVKVDADAFVYSFELL